MKKAILLGIGGYVAYKMVRKSLANKESMLSTSVKKAADFLTSLTETSAVSSVMSAATEGVNKMMHMGQSNNEEGEGDNNSKSASKSSSRKEDDKGSARMTPTASPAAHH